MKKFILCLVVFMFSVSGVIADELNLEKETKYQKKVMETGYRILNANQIDKRMTFRYVNEKNVKAAASLRKKQIDIYKGLIPFFDDDNEIAAILAHEISRGIDGHDGYWRRYGFVFKPKSYEKRADIKGVDLMVKAGYNPVAMIIVLNKITEEPNWFEKGRSHSAGSSRLAHLYEYIYVKYPAYLADNDYKDNLYYQNFLLTSKKERELIKKKTEDAKIVPVKNKKRHKDTVH